MATQTLIGNGIRRNFVTLGSRNFENSGTVQYKCAHVGLNFLGTIYAVGASLTFDVAGTSYSKTAIEKLRLFWNQGWIAPIA